MRQLLNILIIDNSQADHLLLSDILQQMPDNVGRITPAFTLDRGIEQLKKEDFDLIFLDFIIDEKDGLGFLMDLPESFKQSTPIILCTGYGNPMIHEDAISIGAKAYLDKNDMTIETVGDAIALAMT